MKLLYITNQVSGSGGLERVLSIKLSYFAESLNKEVHVLTINDPAKERFFTFSPNINFHNLSFKGHPFKYMIGYIKGLRKIAASIKPDIIIVCDDGLKGLYVPLIIGGNRKFIYERHVSKLSVKSSSIDHFINRLRTSITYFLMDFGGKYFDAFVVLTKGNLTEWRLKNLVVISNPLPQKPSESSILDKKRVIAVGKHCYQKGYDRLLRIWQLVHEKHPDWSLSIYGKYNPYHNLEELANELNIRESVLFSPPVKDIYNELINSSIHVLSSRYEGFGMVIIEAMSCGLPSVSFNCPHGPSDIIVHGKNGYLVENGDEIHFAKLLSELIADHELRKEMSSEARESVDRFAIEKIAIEWQNLFNDVIAGRNSEK